jgi:hypothetical protein
MCNPDVGSGQVFLQDAICIDEEDSVLLDIVVTVEITVTFSGKHLSFACPVIVNQRFNFSRF